MAEALTVEEHGPVREEGMIATEPEGVQRWHNKRLRRTQENRAGAEIPFGTLSRWWKMQAPPGPYGYPPPPPFPYEGNQVSSSNLYHLFHLLPNKVSLLWTSAREYIAVLTAIVALMRITKRKACRYTTAMGRATPMLIFTSTMD